MESRLARVFDENEPPVLLVSLPEPPPSPPPPALPALPAASAPATGTAGRGGIRRVVKGIVYHPDSGKPADCQILLAWTLDERSDGTKIAPFNREIGGDSAVLTGLTPQQLTTGMAMRDACQQAAV